MAIRLPPVSYTHLTLRQSQQRQARQRFAAAAFPNDAKAGSRFKAKMHIPYDQRPSKGVSDSQIPHFK